MPANDDVFVDNNKFEGQIPYEYLVDLPSIVEINLSNNRFNGFVVDDHINELWGMENLQRFDICESSCASERSLFVWSTHSLRFEH